MTQSRQAPTWTLQSCRAMQAQVQALEQALALQWVQWELVLELGPTAGHGRAL